MKFNIFNRLGVFLLVSPAVASDNIDHGDTAWILTSTALVLMMTLPGLALFYAGLVRAKNVISVIVQCVGITCLISVLWIIAGYSLTFSGDGAFIGNFDNFFLANISSESVVGSIPESVFVAFQMTFAIITPALIVGAFVERKRFSAVLLFSGIWFFVVYVPIAHWIWGGGWMAQLGIMDFAGGLVVHTTAGIASLVIVLKVGVRQHFHKTFYPPHSIVLTGIGACLLWVGWFGFNAGSALAANNDAGLALLATHIAAATGGIIWAALEWYKVGKPSLVAIATGVVAGLATVTPAAGYISPGSGFILGIVGGVICYFTVPLIRFYLKIDDGLDVFAVHGMGGIIGSLLLAALAAPEFGGLGLPDGNSIGKQFLLQLLGVSVTVLWTAGFSYLILLMISAVTPLRVSKEQESVGLDLSEHGEHGYLFD